MERRVNKIANSSRIELLCVIWNRDLIAIAGLSILHRKYHEHVDGGMPPFACEYISKQEVLISFQEA